MPGPSFARVRESHLRNIGMLVAVWTGIRQPFAALYVQCRCSLRASLLVSQIELRMSDSRRMLAAKIGDQPPGDSFNRYLGRAVGAYKWPTQN